jgi:hypothetical protein
MNQPPYLHVVYVGSKKRGPSLPRRSILGIAGAALLVASGATHLDLYLTGYRTIPTIGWLFLLQVIVAFVLAVTVPDTGSWLLALVGPPVTGSPSVGPGVTGRLGTITRTGGSVQVSPVHLYRRQRPRPGQWQ